MAALTSVVLTSCNSDVELGAYENIPEVEEHILGMTTQEATDYLSTQGFYFGRVMENGSEYVFSRDQKLSEFSYEASSMLAFGCYNDTVHYASGLQRMETEKSATDLFWKWSRYTAQNTWPEVYMWRGYISYKEDQNASEGGSSDYSDMTIGEYYDGIMIEQIKEQLAEQYNSGQITKEEYNTLMQSYSYNRNTYWSHLRDTGERGQLFSAHETYNTEEQCAHPKETTLSVYMNNGGSIELNYETTYNFVWHWN